MEQSRVKPQIPAEPGASSIWYFAYGSNMRASVMAGRGLHITDSYSVALPSHTLNFDVFGIPYCEPAMASISTRLQQESEKGAEKMAEKEAEKGAEKEEADDVPAVHGAIYRLSRADWAKLVRSEGAGTAYREIDVDAQLLRPAELGVGVVRASTLVARYPFRPNAAPSKRYLDVLVKGAEERGLPPRYVGFLRSIPSTDAVEYTARAGAQGFITLWMFLAGHLMRWVKLQADENGRAPDWMGGLVWCLFNLLWCYHDFIHTRIWSSGAERIMSTESRGSS